MVRSRQRDLRGKLGIHWGMGVVVRVSLVPVLVSLVLLLLLLEVLLPLSFCCCLMCLGGHRR